MTLPPERIGDKGHRYEIWATDEDGEEFIVGWGDHPHAWKELVDKHPGWSGYRAVDRREEESDE